MVLRLREMVLACVIGLMASGAHANDITRQTLVTTSFFEGDMRNDGGVPVFAYRLNLLEFEGILELCGAVFFLSGNSRAAAVQFLRDSAFEINGRPVVKDLRYWMQLSGQTADFSGALANCVSTGVPANAAIENIGMAWSRRSYRF